MADVDEVMERIMAAIEVGRAGETALARTRAQRYHSSLSLSVAGFVPSLHLNLAEDHRTLGDLAQAREHIDLARDLSAVLPEDPYDTMVHQAIARVSAALPVARPR